MTHENEKNTRKTVLDALNQSVEHLDAPTLSRLNQARQHALSQTDRPRLLGTQWLRAATFALVVITVINGWLFFANPDTQHVHSDALELLIANEDFELMQDLDFVTWMIEEEHAS